MAIQYLNGINVSGNVGIGTDSPEVNRVLDVNGNMAVRSNIYVAPAIGETSNSAYSIEIGQGRTGNGYAFLDFVGDDTYSDHGLRIIRGNTGANTFSEIKHRGTGLFKFYAQEAANMTFLTSNSERMRITSAGNVGIGTTSPVSIGGHSGVLTLYGSNATALALKDAVSEGHLRFDDSNFKFTNSSGNVRMQIEADTGNVGINKTNPTQPLHVSGIAQIDNGSLQLGGTSSVTGTNPQLRRTNSSNDLAISTGGSDRITVLGASGNVGIGTTSPSGLLHVSSGTSGDAVVIIESDTDNNNENDNPQLQFKQDGGITIAKAGLTGDAGQIFGNSLGNAAYFGNDENASVQFYTNATAALTIREDGDVGIGTNTPGAKLDVFGDIKIGADSSVFSDGSVTIGIDYNNNQTDRVFNIKKNNSTELFRVQENGNVGIGTTNPSKSLTIQTDNSSYGSMRIYRNSATLGETSIGFFGTATQAQNQSWVIGEGGWGNSGDFVIGNENGGAGGNVRMLIQRDGDVGIGTTSPSSRLEVVSAGANGVVIGEDTSNSVLSSRLFFVNGTTGQGVSMLNSSGHLIFSTAATPGSTSGSEKMRINSSGNVGIGTTSPSEKLHVSGNVRVTGSFRDSNGDAGIPGQILSSTGSGTNWINNDTGDITGVTAGTNLNGGGTSGTVTLNLDSTINVNEVNIGQGIELKESTDRSDLLQITSATSSWGGIQVRNSSNEGRWSFMTDGSNGGFYDDENSDWAVLMNELGSVRLYYDGGEKFLTTSGGAQVYGALTVNDNIIHNGDTDTYIGFPANDTWRVVTSGSERLRVDPNGDVGIGTTSPQSKLQVDGGVQMADDTDTASASKVGTLRYRTSGNNSYVDMCMQTGASTYEWVNIVQNNW